ncbi:MAG: NfeD family protein [Pseudomonadales bacterium]|jgi:membrane protein implicated in regulation of membrane protease activity|nr:NfeD family protein [Pseudomonadales bacterium]
MEYIPTIWIVVGLLLILSELFVTGFVAVFLGFGALVTGIAVALGMPGEGALPFVVFSVVSVCSLLALRARFTGWFKGRMHMGTSDEADDDFLGRDARVLRGFGDGDHGRGEVDYRGAAWSARSDDVLSEGELVVITGRDNLTLLVARQES